MKLSIIIVNWNTKDYLKQTLQSLFTTTKQLPSSKLEIIVVDNNSEDKSTEMVKEKFPKVKLIESKINLGFGGGNNEGAKKATGDYLLFLNSDTIVLHQAIKKILWYLEERSVGIMIPKLLLEDRKTVQSGLINYKPTVPKMILEKPFKLFKSSVLKVNWLRKIAQKISLDFWDFDKLREVDWVTGAALVIRKPLFDEIGGFDEKIFMYFEDVDLCIRAKKKGAKIIYYPDAEIVHLGGKSIAKSKERKKVYYQSQDYFWGKHYSTLSAFLLKIIRFPYRAINSIFTK
ncbi:glycosyltransferase family 2 protein [Patescibacteria group bacterium]